MAAEGGEFTREKKEKNKQVATGGAEQERKGAPLCVRVSVPVRPDLCLSDRQRREEKIREKRRSHSAITRREKFACPKPDPDRNQGRVGGGWVHRQVVATCRWPVPSGQATWEKEEEEKKKKKKKKKKRENNPKAIKTEPIFRIGGKKHYPGETQRTRKLRQKELSRLPILQSRQKKKKGSNKKGAAFCVVSNTEQSPT